MAEISQSLYDKFAELDVNTLMVVEVRIKLSGEKSFPFIQLRFARNYNPLYVGRYV